MEQTSALAQHVALLTDAIAADAFNAATRDRIGGSGIATLTVRLWMAQNGTCAYCGNVSLHPSEGDCSHVVPAGFHGAKRAGYVEGNLFYAHRWCNLFMGNSIATDSMKCPELVPLNWREMPRWQDPGIHPHLR